MSFGIFKGFLFSCYAEKTSASKDSFFYKTVLVAATQKIWRTPYSGNFKLPCKFTKNFIIHVHFKNMNINNLPFPKS